MENKVSFTIYYKCPDCGNEISRLVSINSKVPVDITSLVSEKVFNCRCGTTFATPPYGELYRRL